MPRLSILIPFVGDRDSLENTLASVLQNRPENTEIVVALSRPYEDPYQLGEEVRFARVESGASLLATLNLGFEVCLAPIVHSLACGVTVTDGWADHALARFADRRVAAVAPVALDADAPQRVWAAGLEYRPGGECRRRGRGLDAESTGRISGDLAGPSLSAGFYRRAALGASASVFDPALGPNFAAVDLALRLLEAGHASVCEPASLVFHPPLSAERNSGWTHARQAERLFWRHCSKHGRWRSLAAHLRMVAGEFAANLPRANAFVQLAGRCLASCEWGAARRQSLQFAVPQFAAPPAEVRPAGSDSPGRRLDRPHFELETRPQRAALQPANGRSSS